MKRQRTHVRRRLALALLVAAVLATSAAVAQTGGGYDLTWNTADSGGGSSAASGYQLAGTVGQPDAGATLSGGGYALAGGFWGGASTGGKVYLPQLRR